MANNPAAGSISNVNSRKTKATGPPEIGYRVRNGNAEKARPIPSLSTPSTPPTGVKRKTSIPHSIPATKPPTSLPSPKRAAPSNTLARIPSTYRSPNNLNRSYTSSVSAPTQSPSTRSTGASPSRIAAPRATPPAAGQASRVRANSSSSIPTINSSPRPVKLNSLSPSPRTQKPRTPTTTNSPTPAVPRKSPAAASMDSRIEPRGRLSSGKQNVEERKPISRLEQSVQPTASEVSTNLGLLPGDVDVLKSLWEEPPIKDDPGGGTESPVDRSAVKSGYGSVFGFNLAPKSRTSSVAVTEDSSLDRSQSVSSIASVLSSYSVVSTKTLSNSPAISPTPSVPTAPQTVRDSSVFLPQTDPTFTGPPTPKYPVFPSSTLSYDPPAQKAGASTSELRSTTSSRGSPADTKSTGALVRASGSNSRVSLPVSPRPRSKSKPDPAPQPMPSIRRLSSTPSSKDTSAQLASTSVTRARVPAPVIIPSPPVKYGMPPSTVSATSPIAAPASAFINRKSPEPETSAVSSTSVDLPPRQRYTSNTSTISNNLSPSSPFGLPVDRSASGIHSYSPQSSSPPHPPTVNLKHLLSKPAPAGNSSASESESGPVSKNSRPVRRIERIEEKNEKQRIEAVTRQKANESDGEGVSTQVAFIGGSRERDRARKTEWEAERRLLKQRSLSNTAPSPSTDTKDPGGLGARLARSASWSRSREREGTEKGEKKARNVLKRRPSATSTVAPPESTNAKEFPYSSFAPAYTGSILPVTPIPRSGTLKPPTPGHSSSRGSSPARDEKRRSLIPQSAMLKHGVGGMTDDGASILSGTTPAKEIMLAYKQQQEREKTREKERNERAREKQRERELWQLEEEDRRRRALKEQTPPIVSCDRTPLSASAITSTKGSGTKEIPSIVKLPPEERRSFSAPSTSTTFPHSPTRINNDSSRSLQPSGLPSRTPKSSSEPVSPEEEPAHPYYTVFGDSRQVVPVQGIKPEDSFLADFSWSTSNLEEGISSSIGVGLGLGEPPLSESPHIWERSASVSVGRPSSKGSIFGKTLSRKVSSKLGSSKKEPGLSSAPAMLLEERGRPSLQERTKKDPLGSGGDKRTLRLSIDDYAPSKSPLSSIPVLHQLPMTDEVFKSNFASPQASPTSATGHSGGKHKIWSLMKRISTGGLRDNYRRYDGSAGSSPASPFPPPPVPALPKDLSVYTKGTKRRESLDMVQGLKRNVTSAVAPISTGKVSSSSTTSNRIPTTPSRPHGPLETSTSTSTRAGTATRSSSPISSSDIGSSKFFNRSQSQRSSTSSYGERIPPVPIPPGKVAMLQQHILPPSELYKLHLSLERNKEDAGIYSNNTSNSRSSSSVNTSPSLSNSRSHSNLKLQVQRPETASSAEEWMIVPTPKEERPSFSLPVPQRRKESSEIGVQRPPPHGSNTGRSPSPTIPMFSNDAVINTWSSSRKEKSRGSPGTPPSSSAPLNSFRLPSPQLSSPPAIPSRSPRRAASASASVNSTKLSSIPPLPPAPPTSPGHPGRPGDRAKSDIDSESTSRRAARKSLGPGVSSETQTIHYVRKRATSSSGKSPVRDVPFSSPRPPRSEQPRNPRIHGALSDKEKADKWDILLERSNKAGGTLHLNGGMDKLPSDRLNFSVHDNEDDY